MECGSWNHAVTGSVIRNTEVAIYEGRLDGMWLKVKCCDI
jgi:hypothetical protein